MRFTAFHRRIARTLWDCGGRLDETAKQTGVSLDKLRLWLADPAFRVLMAPDALEPLLQASNALMRWAPVAVGRLIADLESEKPEDARQAARDLLKLALAAQREMVGSLAGSVIPVEPVKMIDETRDPLTARFAAISDRNLIRLLEVLNDNTPDPPETLPQPK